MTTKTVAVRYTANTAQYESAVRSMGGTTRDTSRGIMQAARDNEKSLTQVGVALTAMGASGALAMRSILTAGGDYQAGMNQVRAVTGATGDDFAALTSQARELGASTKFSATEAAGGMSFLAMAGFDAKQTLDALPGTLELAAAGNMDLASAADIASNVLTGYGMEAGEIGRVNDVMAATFTTSNTNLGQLGEAMKYAAPLANAAGVSFEEATAAVGLFGNAGIQGSMAGTSLRGAITQLLNPTGAAAEILERLGVSALDSQGNLLPLVDIVEQLEGSAITAGEMMEVFGLRAGPAMQGLVAQGADALREQTQVALESAGTAAEIASIQMEGFQGAMIELKSAAEGLKIAMFESGVGTFAEMTADGVTRVLRALEGLPEPAHAAATALLAAATAVGLLGGASLLALPRIAATQAAMAGLGIGLAGILGPIAVAAAAVTAATAVYGRYATVKAEATARTDQLKAALDREAEGHAGNVTEMLREELARRGILSQLSNYGLTVADVENAILGETDARDRLFQSLGDQLMAMDALGGVTGEHRVFTDELAGAIDELIPGYREWQAAQAETARVQSELTAEWASAAEIEDVAARATESHRRAVMLLRGELPPTAAEAGSLAGEVGLLAESYENGVPAVEQLTDAQKRLQHGIESFTGPLGLYQELLAEKEAAEREAAEATAAATEDASDSWEDYASSVTVSLTELAERIEEQNAAHRDWKDNLLEVARTAGADVAMILAEMGEDGVELTAKMANGTQAEASRMADALRDQASRGGDAMVRNLESALVEAERVATLGAGRTVDGIVRKLSEGTNRVGAVANAYGNTLADQLNPVLIGVGAQTIAGRPFVPGSAFADGGFLPGDATIERPHGARGLVQWAEAETAGEAFIPLAASKRGRSLAIWEETGRLLGAFADGGFLAGLPQPPDVSAHGNMVGSTGAESMRYARDEAQAWMDANTSHFGDRAVPGGNSVISRLISIVREAGVPHTVTSTLRNGKGTSLHNAGRAVDFSVGGHGNRGHGHAGLRRIFEAFTPFGANLAELILAGAPFNVKNGRQVGGYAWGRPGQPGNHWNHVHAAMADGGILNPHIRDAGGPLLPGYTLNATGGPEMVLPIGDSSSIVDAAVRQNEQVNANYAGHVFAGMTAAEQLADLDRRISQERAFTDEWMRLVQERERVADRIIAAEQQRADERERIAEQARRAMVDAERARDAGHQHLVRLLEQEEQLRGRMVDAQARADADRVRAEERFASQQSAAVGRRAQQVQRLEETHAAERARIAEQAEAARARRFEQVLRAEQQFNDARQRILDSRLAQVQGFARLDERSMIGWGASVAAVTDNVRSQTEEIARWTAGLADLRARGLSEEVIAQLGLDDSPAALGRVEAFRLATVEEIAALNAAVAERTAAAGRQVRVEQDQLLGAVGAQLIDAHAQLAAGLDAANGEYADAVARLADQSAVANATLREGIAAANAEYAAALREARSVLHGELAAIQDDLHTTLAQLNTELQGLGVDTGMSYAEAVARGLQSGLPGVQAAAEALAAQLTAVEEAQRRLQFAEAQAAVAQAQVGRTAGQVAAPAGQTAPAAPSREQAIPSEFRGGEVFRVGSDHYLRLGGRWYRATGPGQVAGITSLYGQGRSVPQNHIGPIAGTVVDLFGGPGALDRLVASLPRYHSGVGMVPGSGERLAVLEGGERVFTAMDNRALIAAVAATRVAPAAATAPHVTVHARVFVGDREITDIARVEATQVVERFEGARMQVALTMGER